MTKLSAILPEAVRRLLSQWARQAQQLIQEYGGDV